MSESAKRMGPLRAVFNDGSEEKHNQCIAYVRNCTCGHHFKPSDTYCVSCGKERPRCSNTAMDGEELCRVHAVHRAYSPYNKLVSKLSDSTLEEFIESDDRGLSQEYALAKLALSHAMELEKDQLPTSEELLRMVKEFFTIAEKKHNIEKGQTLNIAWDDELVSTLRSRLRKYLSTMIDIINEEDIPQDTKQRMLEKLHSRTQMMGNAITAPPN
jgi:hypothetical protein